MFFALAVHLRCLVPDKGNYIFRENCRQVDRTSAKAECQKESDLSAHSANCARRKSALLQQIGREFIDNTFYFWLFRFRSGASEPFPDENIEKHPD